METSESDRCFDGGVTASEALAAAQAPVRQPRTRLFESDHRGEFADLQEARIKD